MPITHSTIDLQVRGVSSNIHYLVQDGPGDAPVILLLHGHGSSVAEFEDLLPELEGKAVVFAFDQPSCGRSADASRDAILAAFRTLQGARHYEALFYLRELVSAFVEGAMRPHLGTLRPVRVAGGSLGGNLALLVAEESAPKHAWLEAAYCWSPGSAWKTGLGKLLAAHFTRRQAARAWSEPDVRTFLSGTYVERVTRAGDAHPQPWYWYFDCWGEDARPECKKQGNGACEWCKHRPTLRMPEGDLLGSSDHYPSMSTKKARHIEGVLLTMAKTSRPSRIGWHWELAAEQLQLSHRQRVAGGLRRIEGLQCPTMFMAGKEDRHFPAPLFEDTRACYELALARQGTPGGARVHATWFEATGHSVHSERPKELAAILAGPPL